MGLLEMFEDAAKDGIADLEAARLGYRLAPGAEMTDAGWMTRNPDGTWSDGRMPEPAWKRLLTMTGAALPPLAGGAGLAKGITGGGAEMAAAASRRAGYTPPVKPQRAFELDYPNGARTDDTGRLLTDIDGRPLLAEFVAGRRSAAGMDEALRPEDVVEGAARLIGRVPQAMPKKQIGGDAGRYRREFAADGNLSRHLFFDKDLPPADAANVLAHEFGHAIDDMAGGVPTAGLLK